MPNQLLTDSLAIARDAGYVRGLLVGAVGVTCFVLLVALLSWFLLAPRRPDPDAVTRAHFHPDGPHA